MRFDYSQQMKLGQHMKLAPRMIQSMEILQMPLADLQERIQQELENNAALEIVENEPDAQARAEQAEAARADAERPLQVDDQSAKDDFKRLEEFQEFNPDAAENEFSASDYGDRSDAEVIPDRAAPSREEEFGSYSPARMNGERDAKLDAMAAAPAPSASLTEQLQDQWALCDVEDRIRALGEIIIPYIEEDGYVRTPLGTIADRVPASSAIKPTAEELEHGLRALQLLLEPAGIAARDVRECLLLQLDAMEDALSEDPTVDQDSHRTLTSARRIIEGYLDDLTQNRLPRISERTGLSMDEIKTALMLMKKLSLAPARRLVNDPSRPIVPDAIVEYDPDEDRYVAYLNEGRVPNLRVNQEYAHMSKDRGVDKQSREFLKTSLGNANWLIDAVNQRKRTLLRVVKSVVEAQREFFDYGPQALKPLPMTQVADQLGIHVATVSRAVSEKYLQTPRGIVPLRKFFTGGTQTDEGEDVSWDAIKAALKDVIEAEDKAKPLSDEALAEELKKRGLEIARRTVAKYREQMGIPTARLRRTF